MKKLFVMTLAVAALASCSKVEPIEPGYKSAIGFGKSFVENSTKALLDGTEIKKADGNFAVWGTEKQGTNAAVAIFAAEKISWDGSAWGYTTQARYWHKDHVFNFAAVAPFSANTTVDLGADLLPETATYTLAPELEDQVDLLYAKSNPNITPDRDDFADKVNFTFDHMLAKVKFLIDSDYTTGYTVVIEGLQIKAAETATVIFAHKAWTSHTGEVALPFATSEIVSDATVESNESLIIPNATHSYVVSGTAKVKMGSTVVKTIPLNYTISSPLEADNHYNITALIKPGNPIQFDVEKVNGFPTPGDNIAM